ncbi:MAG: hypothetical protein IPH08_05905 [Rhodocyclaceae bacterium]|nr:hypothetical protein [Rhodocyclaceae bacterium]
MFKSIQSRLVAAVVALVILLQLISSLLHFIQIRTIVVDRIQSEAQSITAPVLATLAGNLDNIVDPEEYPKMLASYSELLAYNEFLELRKTYALIKAVEFVDSRGTVIGNSASNAFGKALAPDVRSSCRAVVFNP